MASSMAIKTLAASPLTRSPLTKSLSSLVRPVSFSTKSDDDDAIPTAGISRPLADILKELNKKVPDSLVRLRTEDGFNIKYIPWHIVNRIMNLHAPEWSGEVRNITYSADGKSVSVVYRVTLYGTDAEVSDLFYDSRYDMHPVNLCLLVHMHASSLILLLSCFPNASYVSFGLTSLLLSPVRVFILVSLCKIYRESTGTASVDDPGYGDPVQKAEAMAFRRACARFGLGLHLYHEDLL
ncbi:DNA repair RAD52-like protein 1, mitochondrial [Gossypium australe]|uniref:DNA repair RAD52-like protein 1, mitochondrial n=1 Tax=Gossypium australe TaxID=47621 RepID=A0A5B6WSH1_9ROSI|nr:DNA repair RAD52-like protein 1, mitochondrial [Gossypium australe]